MASDYQSGQSLERYFIYTRMLVSEHVFIEPVNFPIESGVQYNLNNLKVVMVVFIVSQPVIGQLSQSCAPIRD